MICSYSHESVRIIIAKLPKLLNDKAVPATRPSLTVRVYFPLLDFLRTCMANLGISPTQSSFVNKPRILSPRTVSNFGSSVSKTEPCLYAVSFCPGKVKHCIRPIEAGSMSPSDKPVRKTVGDRFQRCILNLISHRRQEDNAFPI